MQQKEGNEVCSEGRAERAPVGYTGHGDEDRHGSWYEGLPAVYYDCKRRKEEKVTLFDINHIVRS